MLVFRDNEPEFHKWLEEHRKGYVLNASRSKASTSAILHVATCHHINDRGVLTYTTGDNQKLCAPEIAILLEFADDRRLVVEDCGTCNPRTSQP